MMLLSAKQVAERLSCSVSYIYRLMTQDETFPKPIYIGMGGEKMRGARWPLEGVDAWIAARPGARQQKEESNDD